MSIDITTMHPALQDMLNKIRRCRDAHAGSDAIKNTDLTIGQAALATDEEYLPKLDGQDKKQYSNYKKRAVFYAAMARTVTALAGAIDRKPPVVDGADPIQAFMDDVTGTGVSFAEFLSEIDTEILISGRAVVCVDRKNSSDNRPYLVWYKNENCINWFSEEYTDFNERLSGMVFSEAYYKRDADNPYKQVAATRYREFKLENGNVVVNIWEADEDKDSAGDTSQKEYSIKETYALTNRGKALPFIPCVPIVSSGSAFHIPKPPLLDLVDMNLAHYRNSADYEHGMHWTALPTPVITGINNKDSKITVGSGTALVLPDPQSKATFLEFSGAGLGTIATAMTAKEAMMSALGARMLASKADQSTSAEVTRINYSGETAALCNIAKSISRSTTRLLRMVAQWENIKGFDLIKVSVNEDYVDSKLASGDVTALMQAYQGGAMSQETLIWNLSQGELLPVSRTVQEEIDLIESGMDKEADEAIFWEDSDIGYKGNTFESNAGTATSKQAADAKLKENNKGEK